MPDVLIGMAELQENFRRMALVGQGASSRAVLQAAGEVIRDAARNNVRLKLNKRPTGTLENNIDVRFESDTVATVGTDGIPYAAIHEFGGFIYPRTAKVLRFVKEGEVKFRPMVYIPPRPYMRPAWENYKKAAFAAAAEQAGKEILAAISKTVGKLGRLFGRR